MNKPARSTPRQTQPQTQANDWPKPQQVTVRYTCPAGHVFEMTAHQYDLSFYIFVWREDHRFCRPNNR